MTLPTDREPTPDEMYQHLLDEGGIAACSRYGKQPYSWAPFAVALAELMAASGYSPSEALEGCVSRVVNDDATVLESIAGEWSLIEESSRTADAEVFDGFEDELLMAMEEDINHAMRSMDVQTAYKVWRVATGKDQA